MNESLIALAVLSAVAWSVLLIGRHGFWRMDQKLKRSTPELPHWPGVAVVVPARNEEDTVARCLRALAEQTYEGPYSVILVNDSSSDATAEIARSVAAVAETGAPVRVIDAPPLEPGWAGKLWALRHGLASLPQDGDAPRYVWFTDADVIHGPAVLTRLVAHAQANSLALVSLMVRLTCVSPWERLLVPAFIFFFQMLYPFKAVNDKDSSIAGAAGGCMLVEWRSLRTAGGIDAVKDRLIDDCALAEIIKRSGHGIWLGLAEDSHSLRRYPALGDFWRMVTRSAFVQLRHSIVLLAVSVAGMCLAFLAAPAIVLLSPLHGSISAAFLAGIVWFAMSLSYIPCLRYHGLGHVYALLLPVASGLFTAMTLHSALKHWFGAGSHWKNRDYHPK